MTIPPCYYYINPSENEGVIRNHTSSGSTVVQETSLNKAIVDITLRPRCHHLANSTKHNVVFDFVPLAPLRENIMESTNRKYYRIALSSEEVRATATVKGYEKCPKVWTRGF